MIGDHLYEIETEDDLIHYLTVNRSGFAKQNQAAKKKVEDLIKSCQAVAPKEYAISCNAEEAICVGNEDELLNVIYGYSARATEDGEKVFKKSINKSKLPALIKQNWPQRQQFYQIKNGNASYDVLRRALLMLEFYDFYAKAIVAETETREKCKKTGKSENIVIVAEGLFDEFTAEVNDVLVECGFAQLYWRNPFDWMIGYCAMAPNPLYTLRDLIEEYYLSNSDTFAPPKK